MKKDLRIAVAGTGYVGLSIATLLAQHNNVTRNSPQQNRQWERGGKDYCLATERILGQDSKSSL